MAKKAAKTESDSSSQEDNSADDEEMKENLRLDPFYLESL